MLAVSPALLMNTAVAADGEATPGVPLGAMLQTLLVLGLVLALFVGAAWLLRRLTGGRGLLAQGGPIHVVASLPVGPRERILLVEIGDTWLVVGVAPGQMRTLHTLAKGTLPPPAAGGDGQFGQWLRHFREASRGAGN